MSPDTDGRGRCWYFSSHPLAGYTEWCLCSSLSPSIERKKERESSLFPLTISGPHPLFPRVFIRRDRKERARFRQFDFVMLFIERWTTRGYLIQKVYCEVYCVCSVYIGTLFQLGYCVFQPAPISWASSRKACGGSSRTWRTRALLVSPSDILSHSSRVEFN